MKRNFAKMWPAAALLGFLIAGCDSGHVDKISDLQDNPTKYDGHEVTVAGEVNDIKEVPLISDFGNFAAYRITDGTGQIWVLSRVGAPVKGDKIGLKGKLKQVGSISGFALGEVIQETERKGQ